MTTRGPRILVRTLTASRLKDRSGRTWQYHSRSDHHSKVACWGILFDMLANTPLLQRQAESGIARFGINHEMRDFVHDRKKNLDLVVCTPGSGSGRADTLRAMGDRLGLDLTDDDRQLLRDLPDLRLAPVGSVMVALEAKACMTAHQRALPRLYDELNSSHQTVHGANDQAIAVGFAMVNVAERYLSPDLNRDVHLLGERWSTHRQPRDAEITVDKIRQLPRRTRTGDVGYDAMAIVAVSMANDGSPVLLHEAAPAPASGDIHHYDAMISRLSATYATRFKDL